MNFLGKVKNALKSANKFGIAAILVAGVMAFSFKPDAKRVDRYRYTEPTQQNWDSGTLDQNAGHYTLITEASPTCNLSEKICTYELVDGAFAQATKGDYSE